MKHELCLLGVRKVIILASAAALFGLLLVGMPKISAEAVHNYNFEDWLSPSDVLMMMSHNGAQAKAYSWVYAQQTGTIQEQFAAGSRGDKVNIHKLDPTYFDFETALTNLAKYYPSTQGVKDAIDYAVKKSDCVAWLLSSGKYAPAQREEQPLELAVCHEPERGSNCAASYFQVWPGQKPLSLVDYLRAWAEMLDQNPTEVIFLFFENGVMTNTQDNGPELKAKDAQIMLDQAIEKSGLSRYAYKIPNKYYKANPENPAAAPKLPTFGELRKSNHRAFLFTDNWKSAYEDSPYLNKESIYRTHWTNHGNYKDDLDANICVLLGQNPSSLAFSDSEVKKNFPPNKLRLFRADYGPEDTYWYDISNIPLASRIIDAFTDVENPGNYIQINSGAHIKKRIQSCIEAVSTATQDYGSNKSDIIQIELPVNLLNMDMVNIPKTAAVFDAIQDINKERIEILNQQAGDEQESQEAVESEPSYEDEQEAQDNQKQ